MDKRTAFWKRIGWFFRSMSGFGVLDFLNLCLAKDRLAGKKVRFLKFNSQRVKEKINDPCGSQSIKGKHRI